MGEIRTAGGRADFVAADLGDSAGVRILAERALEIGGGRVDILVNNAAVYMGVATGSVYSSSKGAVESLTRAWAAELGPRGVRVNAISPGIIVTPGLDAVDPGILELTNGDPAGRPGRPEEIASGVAFLVSCPTHTIEPSGPSMAASSVRAPSLTQHRRNRPYSVL